MREVTRRGFWGRVRPLVVTAACLAACRSPTAAPADADAPMVDGSTPDSVPNADDGAPTRRPCTGRFGTALTSEYGRLDGILVAIVPPGGGGCNADSSHVHLQVEVNGAVYDIAVTIGSGAQQDVHTTTRDLTMPGMPWSEGWHPGVSLDYVGLGVHNSDLALEPSSALASELATDLASANHISVFATGYGPDGAHLVHRVGAARDGMIVTKPLASTAHLRLFSFTSQGF